MSERKLLIVDDDPGLQKQLRWCFEDFEVEVAGDRQTALAALKAHKAPVVTLDLGLFCGIVDEHLEMVGQALAQNTAVRSLRLGFNE